MKDERRKDENWRIYNNDDGSVPNMDAHLAVLMDLRDELKQLNRLLNCNNFLRIPSLLSEIKNNTSKRKPRRKV